MLLILLRLSSPLQVLVRAYEELEVNQLTQRLVGLLHELLYFHHFLKHLDDAAHLGLFPL